MIEESVYTALQALAGGRVYPMVAPENCTLPNIVYQRISGGHLSSLSGLAISRPRIQVSCHAESYPAAKALAESVKTALVGLPSMISGDRDSYHQETKTYTTQIDFLIWD